MMKELENVKSDTKNRPDGRGRILSSCVLRPASCRRNGFTLMELLLVMVISAILGAIIMGSATYITRVARTRRAEVACAILESALIRYRSDYNKWPAGGITPSSKGEIVAAGANNAKIFGMLRENNQTDNPRAIRFFDETTLYTIDARGKAISLRQSSGDAALVYTPREGGGLKYFKVVINVDNDTANVTAPELNN